MRENLTTEARNAASEGIDALSALEIVRLMNAEDERVAGAVLAEAENIALAIETIAERLRKGGRLIYLGAGTSGRLGVLDAAECPPTFNTLPGQVLGLIAGGEAALTRAVEGAEDHPEFAIADLEAVNVGAADVVVGIASSGRTPYVIGGLKAARERGAFTIGFSCNAEPDLIAAADLMITPVVGPEVITGSTRLKAGTATKLTLNMLTTGAMVLLGKTYGNLMVDLRATNNKLLERTRRIVMLLTGLDAAQAESLLAKCNGELKTAVVANQRALTVDRARELLARAGGHLRRALQEDVRRGSPDPAESSDRRSPLPSGDLRSTPVARTSALRGGARDRPQPGDPPQPLEAPIYVLGIDGGGSKTAVRLARQDSPRKWTTIGRGVAGASNPQSVGFEMAFQNLDAAVDAAFADARLLPAEVAAACGALAGAERDADKRRIEEWARGRRLALRLSLVHDALPLLAAGTPAGFGVGLICGTGSFAFGQNERGETARAGGWGYLLGDEGSGYAIALAALQASAHAADDRGPATRLLDRFMKKFDLAQPLDLINLIYQSGVDRATIAGWADVVIEGAAAGDAVATGIVSQAARDMAETVAAVCRKIGFDRGPFPLALGGGLVVHHASYRDQLQNELNRRGLRPDPIGVVPDPVAGAVILAQRFLLQ
jgi:N-acetylmuramic acid 6-phosphate etherase